MHGKVYIIFGANHEIMGVTLNHEQALHILDDLCKYFEFETFKIEICSLVNGVVTSSTQHTRHG